MKILKISVILIPLLCFAGLVFADHFKSDEAYAYGYRAGYNHGVTDGAARVQFDYRRSYPGPNIINFKSYDNDDFQKGYKDGYTDAFYREQRTQKVASNYGYDPQGFKSGYREGYYHGLADRQKGLELNYQRDPQFESGVSYRSYSTATFQGGYENGYKQGYYGASLNVGYRPSSTVLPATPGFVTAFTDDEFDGKMREFSIGRYSDLDGDWDDSLESIQVHGPVRVILFEDDDFEGKQLVIERTTKDLDDFNFDDKAGSMIVEPLY